MSYTWKFMVCFTDFDNGENFNMLTDDAGSGRTNTALNDQTTISHFSLLINDRYVYMPHAVYLFSMYIIFLYYVPRQNITHE